MEVTGMRSMNNGNGPNTNTGPSGPRTWRGGDQQLIRPWSRWDFLGRDPE